MDGWIYVVRARERARVCVCVCTTTSARFVIQVTKTMRVFSTGLKFMPGDKS